MNLYFICTAVPYGAYGFVVAAKSGNEARRLALRVHKDWKDSEVTISRSMLLLVPKKAQVLAYEGSQD